MSIGSILVGVAVALVVGVYVARPFRKVGAGANLDQSIETWVAHVRVTEGAEAKPPSAREVLEGEVNFCPKCGRRVEADHQFCPGCGRRLRGGGA
ncbi:MAG: zinc ribbon domain-containing protein [Anaerolineae bacterium]|nr:zinc ribbon domain-containing protein [Anaerolineae bacterium]